MRITNKMMSGNSLANINTNKEYLDKLNNQMATEKKITRPSDDPIVAIRALRLRSNLSELTQYFGANVPDAQAWVEVTQSAIMSTKEMLTSLKAYADQGANGTNTASDRQKIYENMQALQKQIYLNGNATNAGRSVFTGYRTGESLTFTQDTTADYRGIWDSFNASDVTRNTYVEGAPTLDEISKLSATGNETSVKEDKVNRIRLSYENINAKVKDPGETGETGTTSLVYRTALGQTPSIDPDKVETDPVDGLQSFELKYGGNTYQIKKNASGEFVGPGVKVTQNNDKSFTVSDGTGKSNVFNVSANGRAVTSYYAETELEVTITNSEATVNDGKTAYQYLALGADNKNTGGAANKIYLLADTGELVFGSDVADILGNLKDIPGVDTISVKYDKNSFKTGELRPEHYFDCKQIDDNNDIITYDDHRQEINYTVGTNQSIKINTNAEDVFDTQIIREIDDIITAIDEYNLEEEKVNKLKAMQEDSSSYNETQRKKIQQMLDAANKGLDIAKNKLQRTYEEAITQFGNFFDQANLAETACGTVDNRLTLVSNRLSEEKTTVTTLASENENVDITNIAVEVSEANLVYNAALMATGRISQQTLVDYI